MRIYYTLLVIILVACSTPKLTNENTLILSEETINYTFKVSEVRVKYNEKGEKECSNYSNLSVDSTGFIYYGVDIDELLSYLHKVDLKQIQFLYPVPNVILNIECTYNSKPESFDKMIESLLNHYAIKEQKINTNESALNLVVDDSITFSKCIDTNRIVKSRASFTDNVLTLKKINLVNIAKCINNNFPSYYIVADSTKKSTYSLTLNSLNSIEDVEMQLKNDYGLKFKESNIVIAVYKYSKM